MNLMLHDLTFRGRWFMFSASTRRAGITAPLGDGMSRLDASQASVSDPFVSPFSFLDSRPPPVVLVLASVVRVVCLVVQGQLGMCSRSKLPVRELAGLLGNGLWDHSWPAVTTLDQVFRQCSQGVTMPNILQTLTLATCIAAERLMPWPFAMCSSRCQTLCQHRPCQLIQLEPAKHRCAGQQGADVTQGGRSTGRFAVYDQLTYVPYILADTESLRWFFVV